MCNTERESACTPGANKSHDIIAWQEEKSGLVRLGGVGGTIVTILPLGAHPLERIRTE